MLRGAPHSRTVTSVTKFFRRNEHMKKIIALLLAVVMVFALVACASTAKTEEKTDAPAPAETTNEQTTAPAEEPDAPAEDETAEPAGDAVGTDIKIGVVLIGDENEGYTYSHIKGIQEAAKALGISENNIVWKYSIGEDETCYDACVDCVDQGCQIVITNSYGHQSFCRQAAEEYPDVQFVAMTGDTARADGLANFHNAFTGIYEARYVGGVVAGMKLQQLIDEGKVEDKNKTADGKIKIGYVGAFPYAEVVSGYTAFFLGIRSVYPDVVMEVNYTNSWFDIAKEKEAALNLINSGCVLISQHADSEGAPKACEEKNVPNVAYNISTISMGPNTALISSKIDWAPYFKKIINAALEGSSIPSDYCGTIGEGYVALTELNEKVAAAGTKEKLEEVKAKLVSGELKVFDTDKFTVNGKKLDSYKADVVDMGDYVPDSEVVKNGEFEESTFRSAPYFDIKYIDGISKN